MNTALAMPNGTGKVKWQQLLAEAISARSEEQLVMLITSAGTNEAAQAIVRHAQTVGIDGRKLARAVSRRLPEAIPD